MHYRCERVLPAPEVCISIQYFVLWNEEAHPATGDNGGDGFFLVHFFMMQPYANTSGKSGILQYESGEDFIRIKIRNKGIYLYTYGTTGSEHVERMKVLARKGRGLSRYIARFVRGRYASRELSIFQSLFRIAR